MSGRSKIADLKLMRGVRRWPGISAVVIAIALAGPSNADYVIDSFTGIGTPSPWPLVVNAQTPFVFGFEDSLAGVYGGGRQSSLYWEETSPPESGAIADILTSQGLLDYQSSGGASAKLQLVYGGSGGLNLDLSGEVGLQIDFSSLNLPMGSIVRVNTFVWDGSQIYEGTTSPWVDVTVSRPQAARIYFADFDGDPVDWSTIQIMAIAIDAGPGVNYQIDQVATFVPAPGTLALLAVTMAGCRRRRR